MKGTKLIDGFIYRNKNLLCVCGEDMECSWKFGIIDNSIEFIWYCEVCGIKIPLYKDTLLNRYTL